MIKLKPGKEEVVVEEVSVEVLMYPSEIKKILNMLWEGNSLDVESWANIQGGLPKHLVDVLKKIQK
jgi:hypothetical protein